MAFILNQFGEYEYTPDAPGQTPAGQEAPAAGQPASDSGGRRTSATDTGEDILNVLDPGSLFHGDNRGVDAAIRNLTAKRTLTEQEQVQLAQLTAQKRENTVTSRMDPEVDALRQRDLSITNNDIARNGMENNFLMPQRTMATNDLRDTYDSTQQRFQGATDSANAEDRSNLSGYQGWNQDLSNDDLGALGKFRSTYSNLGPLDKQAQWNGDLVSDPALVAAQGRAQSTLEGFGNGALDYKSQAAGSAADPRSIEAQNNALQQFGSLTKPQETAEEQFMREKARTEQFRQEKSNRDAVMRNLSDRGMSGSGQELAMMRNSSAQNSQNRLLSDLGANANAGQRAMSALSSYGSLAGSMRDSSFNEDLARGSASDLASRTNATNRITGAQAGGTQANLMRDDSDALDKFNRTESLAQANLQDTWKQQERDKAADRASEEVNQGRLTTDQLSGRAKQLYDAQTGTTATTFGRTKDALNSEAKVGQAKYGLTQDWADDWQDVLNGQQARDDGNWGRGTGIAGAAAGATNAIVGVQGEEANRLDAAGKTKIAGINSDIAAEESKRKSGGILDIF